VVYGVGKEERVRTVCGLSDYFGDFGVVFCGQTGGIENEIATETAQSG
jgi:hypothetical protein